MPKQVQRRRGTAVQHSTFTGAAGEITVDTTNNRSVVHDGSTAGGHPSAKLTEAALRSSNLSDLQSAATARGNLRVLSRPQTSNRIFRKVGGLVCDGGSGVITVADSAMLAIGTGDFTLEWEGTLADYTPSGAKILMEKQASNLGLRLYLLATGIVRLQIGNGSNFTTYQYDSTAAVTDYIADGDKLHLFVTLDRDGNATFYVGDQILGAAVAVSSSSAQTVTSSGALRSGYDGSTYTAQTLYSLRVFSKTLSQLEVTEIVEHGLPPRLRSGSVTKIMDGSTLNGGFETAGGGGGDVFGSWSEIVSGSSTINDETSDVHSGSHALRMDIDGSNESAFVVQSILTTGRQYTVIFWAKASATPASLRLESLSGGPAAVTFNLTANWAQYSHTFTADSTFIRFIRGAATSKSIFLDDVEVFADGALVDLDTAVGVGYQAHDLSGNNLHAIIAGGVTHKIARREGQLRFATNTSGNQQAIGQVSIPGNSRLRSHTMRAQSGTPTVQIGTSLGGAQIIASVALSTAIKDDFTFVTRLPSTAPNTPSSIWVNSNSTDVVEHCISYEIISP